MITAKKLSFAHRDFQILKGIDVSIKPGELLIIIGPNGAGKSTLLSMLANENAGKEDVIYFKQKKFEEWNPRILARHKAKFSQEHNADIGLAVKDIVLMGRYPYFKSVPHQTDWQAVNQMMNKTEVFELKDRKYNSLSGGEKQRVHLARVLAQLQNEVSPKLAFFDEPLNNLDIKYQYQILNTVQEFTRQGNSAILVLHDLNLTAEFADKVLLLKKGKAVKYGVPEDIFTEEIIKKAYDFPCAVCANPVTRCPMIIFGNAVKECPVVN